MTTPSARARQALGARLREIRRDARLTARALADVCGWHHTKISKIEHGTQNPSDDDLDDAVTARMQRQQYLHRADRRYLVVLEEQALRTRVGTAETMCGQLDRLLVLMSSHRISLGIIPAMGERRIWVSAGFWIFDQGTVRVETPSAELTITQRGEIAVYEKRFARLQESAVYGDAARAVIRGVGADFRDS